ncbi:MAG: hypothetical protein ACK4SA_20200 [Caldilinea sp.]
MPDFPDTSTAPRSVGRVFTVQMLAAGGDMATVSLDSIDSAVVTAELETLRTRIGQVTNAAVLQTTESTITTISKSRANPLDEAYASAADKLILTFQNDDLTIRSIAIPAPDEIMFGDDGITAVVPNAAASAGTGPKLLADLITAIRTVLNGGAAGSGTYQYLNGYRSQRSRKLPKPRTSRRPVEPAPGQNPPAAPGT